MFRSCLLTTPLSSLPPLAHSVGTLPFVPLKMTTYMPFHFGASALALEVSLLWGGRARARFGRRADGANAHVVGARRERTYVWPPDDAEVEIGRASCRERV